MKFTIETKPAFSILGYSATGTWKHPMVYPIPDLWKKAEIFIHTEKTSMITGVCLTSPK